MWLDPHLSRCRLVQQNFRHWNLGLGLRWEEKGAAAKYKLAAVRENQDS